MPERGLRTRMSVVFALAVLSGSPGNAETPDPPVPLFAEEAEIALTIEAPWRQLRRLPENRGPFPATVRIGDGAATVPATVEKRGISRQELCDMPPIRIRFDEDEVEGTPFEGNRSIKVVTHCRKGDRWEQYYVLEFLAYRLYNRITDISFRVRPATLVYADGERDDVDGPHFGFLIEDDRLVANRHGLDAIEVREVAASDLPADETSLFSLFQYLIGNTDFSPQIGPDDECCHNVKLIGDDALETLYAVPYDFDSSGWVDARYAVPPEKLPINDVRQRLYRGFCLHDAGLAPARRRFLERRPALRAVVESEPRLSDRSRRRALRYLDDFYEVLTDDRQFRRRISGACRS